MPRWGSSSSSYKLVFNSLFVKSSRCQNGQRRARVSTYYLSNKDPKVRYRVPLLQAPGHLGHATSRMTRPTNEDRFSANVLDLPSRSSFAPREIDSKKQLRHVFNLGVYDGHGGAACSEFIATELPKYIEECNLAGGEDLRNEYSKTFGGYWRRWGAHELDQMRARMDVHDDLMLRAPLAFLQADYDFCQQRIGSGSTCTSIFLYSLTGGAYWDEDQQSKLVIAHVGDTRCIISDKMGTAHALTTNHHPSSPVEAARLRRYSASFITDSFGEERFGVYANTRSFGDVRMKRLGVSAEPEMSQFIIGKDVAIDQSIAGLGGSEPFLVLCSDGVANYASDQEIVDLVISTTDKASTPAQATPQAAANQIINYVEAVGSDDNATCLVVRLPGWRKWAPHTDPTGELRDWRIKNRPEMRRQ